MKKKLAFVILCVACTEAVESNPDAGKSDASVQDSSTNDVVSGNDAAPNDAGTTCGFVVDAGALALVVNEIRAKGTEFVELYNPTSGALDLSNVKVADTVSDSGCPKTSEALVFPNGTQLGSGQYLVIFTSSGDAGGPFTDCHDAGATCWQATWSISNSSGESVFVLSSTDVIATSANYPANAVDSGLSWGRLPNATGAFAPNLPTPGATNIAP